MKNNDYLLPGISAIVLAFLFPLSWLSLAGTDFSNIENIQYEAQLGGTSLLFLIVGIISIFVYYSLMKILHDHYNYRKADFILITTIIVQGIYTFGSFAIEVSGIWLDPIVTGQLLGWLFMASLVTFGIIDIVMGIVLIVARDQIRNRIIAFAILNLIMGVCELSIILSPVVLLLFPVICLILAFTFLAQPEEIEIV